MADEDNTTSASTHALHHYSANKNQQQKLLLQRVGTEGEVSHSSASRPFPAQPLSYHTSSILSCGTPGPVKCLDADAVSCLVQGGYHGGGCGCASLQPLRSASASSEVVVSCFGAVADEVALGLANGLPRKRKYDDIIQVSRGIQTRGQKTSRIEDIIDAPGSAVCKDRTSSAKDTVQKKDNCNESQLEAEALSSVFYNTSSILPHSENAFSEPSSEALEAILGNLQKKDTYGVFSKPVDAVEVPGYYDVIKEPMDFGTIRNKLSKGTYVSLDLFKKDVYLICSNAMHFNGPKTIYFKQARSIQDAARKAMNSLARQISGLDSYSKLTNKRKATGAKQFRKSLSTCNNNFQLTNVNDRPRATLAFGKVSAYKNGAIMLGNAVYDRVGKSLEEDMGTKDMHVSLFQSGGGEKESPLFECGTSLKSRKCSPVFEDCRSSYQPSSCRATVSEDVQQLFPMGCQQQHAYARSLAYFGANFKSAAWKYVAGKIQKTLAPHISFGPGWVVRKDPVAAATLMEDVDPLKIQSKGLGGSLAAMPDRSSVGNKILVCSLPCTADVSCTSESTVLSRKTKLSPVSPAATEASQASSVLTRADPQCQSTGSNIKAQFKSSSRTLKQSACGASQDTSTLFSTCPIENYRAVNSDTIGDGQQIGMNSTADVSFEVSNKKEVHCVNQSSRVLKNALLDTSTLFPTRLIEKYGADTLCAISKWQQGGRISSAERSCEESNKQEVYCMNQLLRTSESATLLKEETTIQREEAIAQMLPARICGIGDEQSRGSFGLEQWNALGQRANAVLDFPAVSVIPSCRKYAGIDIQRVLSWGQMQIQGRDLNMSSEFYEQRVSDVLQPPQNPPWDLESYTQTRSNIYLSPEGTYLQSEPLCLPNIFTVSEPRNREICVSNSNLLAAHRQLQSVSGSLCHPQNSLTSQKSLGQIATPFLVSDSLTPCIPFPIAPQGLTISSQQPNLALQL